MRRIVLLTGNSICHNPRVFKEAEALADAGFDVECLVARIPPDFVARDRDLVKGRQWRSTPVVDWTQDGSGARKQRRWQRFRRWLGLKTFQRFGWETGAQLGYCGRELLAAACQRDADLFCIEKG